MCCHRTATQKEQRGQRAGQRVHLRANREAPEGMIERERQRDGCGDRAADFQTPQYHEGEQRRHGRKECRHRVDAPGERTNGNLREAERDEHVKRIAGWMRRAEHTADVLKLGGIAAAAEAWKERLQVDAECDECDDGGDEPVASPYRGGFALLIHRFGLHRAVVTSRERDASQPQCGESRPRALLEACRIVAVQRCSIPPSVSVENRCRKVPSLPSPHRRRHVDTGGQGAA